MGVQLAIYRSSREMFPPGTIIAGIPVGGLTEQKTLNRLEQVYLQPVELHYQDAIMNLDPVQVQFQLAQVEMLSTAREYYQMRSFWFAFREYLWDIPVQPGEFPLMASVCLPCLRGYLTNEIAPRYDQTASTQKPIPGTNYFDQGKMGRALNIDRAVKLVEYALRSPTQRQVDLPVDPIYPQRASMQNLEIFLKQTINLSGFDGLTALYMVDLQTGANIHFALQLGRDVPVKPDIPFSATNLIHVPIMTSVYRRVQDTPSSLVMNLMEGMVVDSDNQKADLLMEEAIHPWRAPLVVTEDMRALHLENTFLAGFFSPGSMLLDLFYTPANKRDDVSTNPDIFNQTTVADMGMLLEDVYHCAEKNGGTLRAIFKNEITQAECHQMIDLLSQRKIGNLIEGGLPEGIRLAHKYGWVTIEGAMTTLGDVGIIYSQGGDYILGVFLNHPVQIIWDPYAGLISDLSSITYNYFNTPSH